MNSAFAIENSMFVGVPTVAVGHGRQKERTARAPSVRNSNAELQRDKSVIASESEDEDSNDDGVEARDGRYEVDADAVWE